jgi:hypothetical protein
MSFYIGIDVPFYIGIEDIDVDLSTETEGTA